MSSLWCAYLSTLYFFFFFFNDTATTEIYPLSLHDALPISRLVRIARHGEESPGSVYPVSGRFLAQSRQLPGTPWTITVLSHLEQADQLAQSRALAAAVGAALVLLLAMMANARRRHLPARRP